MERKWRTRIRSLGLCAVVLLALFLPLIARAAEEKAVSTVVYDGSVYVYIRGVTEIQSGSGVQIGNVMCDSENISTAAAAGLEVPMRTIVLVDNSKSIPGEKYENIQAILLGLIENALEGEQFRIGTFSEELTWLCEDTGDRDTLIQLVDALSYNNQDTYLSDVLYSLITALNAEDTYVYTRILVISDGADDQAIGYTNDEVRSLIEKSAYPIYTIGVPGKNNSDELETMFSFSRASSAEYFLLDGSASDGDIVSALLADQGNLCVKIALDESMKDGNHKSILLRLVTPEGELELVTGADMPFGSGVLEGEPEQAEDEKLKEEEPEQAEEAPEDTLPSISAAAEEAEPTARASFLIPALLAGVLFAAALVLLIVFTRRKKKPKQKTEEVRPREEPAEEAETGEEPDETEFADISSGRDSAKDLWGQPKTRKYLVLTNLENRNIRLKATINGSVTIGRGETDIVIKDDRQVSHRHCEIILRGGLLYIKDLNSKNGTEYEHIRVHDETPMVSGGKVKIGQYTYRVDLTEE